MVFWLAVLMGGLFAWIAVQIGFYATWILFFHLLLSAYMAIFLTPVVLANLPAATTTPYGYAMTFVCIAIATLFVVYGICFACLTGQLRVEFPKVFDTIMAGVLGFDAGFLVLSFVSFTFCLTPLSQSAFSKEYGLSAESQRTNIHYLCWSCDLLHSFIASRDGPSSSELAVGTLLDKTAALSAKGAKPDASSEPGQPQPPPPPPTPSKTAPSDVAGQPPASSPEPAAGKDTPKADAKGNAAP